MTAFPSLLNALTTALLDDEPQPENPRHRALLDAHTDIQDLDRQFIAWADRYPSDDVSAADQLEALVDLLVERLAAGMKLSRLLSTACCCADAAGEDTGECRDFLSRPGESQQRESVLHAALEVFSVVGDPAAMASADLVTCLRDLPGVAGGHWRYAELTQRTLAHLLTPYGIRTRNITLPDGRRVKSYRREDLMAALPL
ncbi:DUF3631 domain-containing protein [Streptomyces sp. NPDC056244]|uniref:DUF3631 domain-containing protein n=1 Tax=Streptomyces sp. NPDC056244 TaxID=3345762 RepID=UPI0035D6F9E9